MSDDLVRIYRTLAILDKTSERSFSKFVAAFLLQEDNHRLNIKRIAAALNKLSYDAGGSFSVKHFEAGLDKMDLDAAGFNWSAPQKLIHMV